MAQAARAEVSRVNGDLRVKAMDAALHLSRHGPLLKLQLSRVHHRATHNTENRHYRHMICKTFKLAVLRVGSEDLLLIRLTVHSN